MPHSRAAAMILIDGSSSRIDSSSRTWSFVVPMQPCARADAPSIFAISTSRFAMSGRPRAAASG